VTGKADIFVLGRLAESVLVKTKPDLVGILHLLPG